MRLSGIHEHRYNVYDFARIRGGQLVNGEEQREKADALIIGFGKGGKTLAPLLFAKNGSRERLPFSFVV
ncbi:hypothetical protein [Paenibacillus periandrae]|uniref:hypothetical protein n=1 Tax=Paenibacillus periandrae TaxID=1761741 RepID=UPI001F08D280|nr:hypothetical protein [Paenibacillus periandrae]